jgi:hypothetical protein
MIGGYGVDSRTGVPNTKDTLTAIDVPGLMRWVKNSNSKKSAADNIRQISDPLLRVTGGDFFQTNAHQPFLLIHGQQRRIYKSSTLISNCRQWQKPIHTTKSPTCS